MSEAIAFYDCGHAAPFNPGEALSAECPHQGCDGKYEGAEYPEIDPVNHPSHYTGHPSGIECIQITEHMNFCLGNALKYIWRADLKHDALEDLKKAKWYIEREIAKREAESTQSGHKPT